MLLSYTEKGASFISLFYETVSAFGTAGLTLGLTSELSNIGKLLIIFMMYLGRVGPLTVVLSITRKKIKSIIMLFILFGIATAVLSGISIKKAANIARQDSNKDMANTFELQANLGSNLSGTIPESLIDKLSKVDGVKNYDAAIQGAGLDLENVNYIKPEKNAVQYNDDYKYEKLFSVEAHKSSEYDTKFISKSLKLVDGRHIVPTDKGKVLIHKALAEANNLKVGDTIKATKSDGDFNASTLSKSDYDLEIVGIFESENTERAGHKLEMPENLLITDVDTVKTLYGYSDGKWRWNHCGEKHS